MKNQNNILEDKNLNVQQKLDELKNEYKTTPELLGDLCSPNDPTNTEKLEKIGGPQGIAKTLQTNLRNGLPHEDLKKNVEERKLYLEKTNLRNQNLKTFGSYSKTLLTILH
ncbi:hypothetical protein M0812_29917 [Anaeramoeba flamelloides]|uniref:Uncharacterized protein n=1 Tax=Anaeramoeba flamelloides TaxID=1746091 RepID=A0AAV7Y0K6_9EUKA|nr:hypothetical protein M0812_29917 [Anaeramoeba flamelloides]